MKKTRNKKSGLVAIGSEAKGWEYRKSWGANWDDGGKGLTLGTNFWSGSGGLNDLNQRTGLLGLHSGDFSFAMTNDAWLSGDKYRTAAAEVGVGDYSFGLNLYTSEPPKEEYGVDNPETIDRNYKSPIWGDNKFGAYSAGERIFAGAYFSVRRGSHIQRIGVDAPFVQDFFQNGIHRHIIKGPYFNTNFGSGPNIFIQNFTQNPWALYSN